MNTTVSHLTVPAPGQSLNHLLDGPAGAIETILAAPREPRARPGVALVCHPHPLYGGAMSNKVAYTLASTAQKAGLHVLRFNFRGVGRSAGAHDAGRGETDDAVFLAEKLQALVPDARLLLAGFSFGAYIALMAAQRLRPQALVSIAPPFGEKYFAPGAAWPLAPGCPWRVLHSRDDEVVPYDETAAALRSFSPPAELVTVDGAGHFFNGQLGLITQHVQPFIEQNF